MGPPPTSCPAGVSSLEQLDVGCRDAGTAEGLAGLTDPGGRVCRGAAGTFCSLPHPPSRFLVPGFLLTGLHTSCCVSSVFCLRLRLCLLKRPRSNITQLCDVSGATRTQLPVCSGSWIQSPFMPVSCPTVLVGSSSPPTDLCLSRKPPPPLCEGSCLSV